MLLITCPFCGARPELEFRNMGESHLTRPPFSSTVSDEDWAELLYFRTNPKGLVAERWRHLHGCGRIFTAVRHTVTDKFVTTYKVGDPRPDLSALARQLGGAKG